MALDDLASVSDTHTRFKNIARSVFARKYGNCLISIDTFAINANSYENEIHKDTDLIAFKDRPIVRVTDPRAWCKILRNFGESIKYIRLHHHRNISDCFWRYIIEYISSYCSASLCVLEVHECQSLPLCQPLTKLHTFIATGWSPLSQIEALELMPNLYTLNLKRNSCPNSIEKHFPNLEKVELHLDGANNVQVHSLISFLRTNKQIKKLKLKICTINGTKYTDLIYSSIIENLTQLKSLEITSGIPGQHRYGRHLIDATTPLPNYWFRSIDTFGYRANNCQGKEHFEFNDLKKLILGQVYAYTEMDVINFILRNEKLKILKLTEIDLWHYSNTFIPNFRKMLTELTELVEVIIQPAKKSLIEGIWNKVLKVEWKLIHEAECKNEMVVNKMKFIRNVSKM